MNKQDFSNHISQRFNKDMARVFDDVMTMGAKAEEMLTNALQALIEGDEDLAQQVIAADSAVNQMDVDLCEDVVNTMAKQSPVAQDLRMLMSAVRVSTDLERVGDEAQKVAKAALKANNLGTNGYSELINMCRNVLSAFEASLDAFGRMDVEQAVDVVARDIEINEEFKNVTRIALTYMMEDPRNITRTMDVIWAAKGLERIADHSKNICQAVVYLCEGVDVRYTDPNEVKKVIVGQKA
jgi:phosphate transport system protein